MHLVGIPHAKLQTKFEVCSPNNFQDIWNRLQQILGSHDLGHAHFGENYLSARLAFPRRSGRPKLKSLAQAVLTICSIVCQKIEVSRDISHAPFEEN